MASKSEVGHARNVANFQDLIAFVNGYGATYDPTKNSLKLTELETLYTQAAASLNGVINKKTDYDNAVNERIEAFEDLRPLSTRLVNALESTDASKEKIDDAKGFNRKIQGQRASKIETPTEPYQPVPRTKSSSQQSYDQLIQHFEGMISILASEPSYTPNETELQIVTLQTKLQDMKVKNEQISIANAEISNARIERNKTLYSDNEGLVDTASDVKRYTKSLFGAMSPEFAQIKGIKFTKVK